MAVIWTKNVMQVQGRTVESYVSTINEITIMLQPRPDGTSWMVGRTNDNGQDGFMLTCPWFGMATFTAKDLEEAKQLAWFVVTRKLMDRVSFIHNELLNCRS